MADPLPQLREEQADGVPVLWAETGGPMRATLAFRVGFVDEPLARRGTTHLIEHLAMFALGKGARHANGFVDSTFTAFLTEGSPEEVVAFLDGLCRALGSLPHDRLETEKRVLAAEAADRSMDFGERVSYFRYGAVGHGLRGMEELGLAAASPETLDAWRDDYFTAGNAVLTLTGPPPPGLRLPLPAGERRLPAEPRAIDGLRLPARLCDGRDGMGIHFQSRRSMAASAAIRHAGERLYDELRHQRGIVYEVQGFGEAATADERIDFLAVPVGDADAPAALEAMLGVLRALAEDGSADDELARDPDDFRRSLQGADGIDAELGATALDTLLGKPPLPVEERLARIRSVTAEDTAAAMREALGSALLVLPDALDGDPPEGFVPYERPRPEPVRPDGAAFVEKPTSDCTIGPCELVLGEGVLYWKAGRGDGELAVRLGDVVAAVEDPGDELTLVRRDGAHSAWTIWNFERGDELLAGLKEAIEPERWVARKPRAQALDDLARSQLEHPEAVGGKITRAHFALAPDEEVRELSQEGEGGGELLVATDRRTLRLTGGSRPEEVEIAETAAG